MGYSFERITITNAFQKILDGSNHKPNRIWVDKGSKFYNRSLTSQLEKNGLEMYSKHKENLLLLKDLLESDRRKDTSILPKYQKCYY